MLSPARRTPSWALSTVQILARGKDRKRDLGSSPSAVEVGEGLPRALQQGEERQRSWELRDSELVGWEPGTSAPDGPAHEEGLLAPHLLQRSPFKGSQPSVVRSLLPHCPDLGWTVAHVGHYTGTVCWEGLSPGAWFIHCYAGPCSLKKLPRIPPACLCLPFSVILWGQIWGTWISPLAICADCKEAASSCALAVWRLHRLFLERVQGYGCRGDSGGWTVITSHSRSPPLFQAGWSLLRQSFLQKPLDRRALVQPFWKGACYC